MKRVFFAIYKASSGGGSSGDDDVVAPPDCLNDTAFCVGPDGVFQAKVSEDIELGLHVGKFMTEETA